MDYTESQLKTLKKFKMLNDKGVFKNTVIITSDSSHKFSTMVGKPVNACHPQSKEDMELLLFVDAATLIDGMAVVLNNYAKVSGNSKEDIIVGFTESLKEAMNKIKASTLGPDQVIPTDLPHH